MKIGSAKVFCIFD